MPFDYFGDWIVHHPLRYVAWAQGGRGLLDSRRVTLMVVAVIAEEAAVNGRATLVL